MSEFVGNFNHNLDQKNRLAVPSKLREDLGDTFVICLPRNGDKCIFAYSLDDWQALMDKLNDQPPSRQLTIQQRLIHMNTDKAEIDKQGRVSIRQSFLDYAGIKHEVFILGAGKRIEMWDPDEWNAMYEKCMSEDSGLSVDFAF